MKCRIMTNTKKREKEEARLEKLKQARQAEKIRYSVIAFDKTIAKNATEFGFNSASLDKPAVVQRRDDGVINA